MESSKLTALICCIIAIAVVSVQSLDPNDVTEGPCINFQPASNFDANWFGIPRMWTNPGGSKYFLYRISAGYPGFPSLREFEFYYYACPQAWFDLPGGNVTGYGFGQNIGSYNFNVIGPGIIEFSARPPVPGAGEKFISTITLTDNKTFAVIAKCFTGVNQRAWDLFTINPNIVTPQFQEMIEEHVISMGFDRMNFAFLRYDYCNNIRQGYGSGLIPYY